MNCTTIVGTTQYAITGGADHIHGTPDTLDYPDRATQVRNRPGDVEREADDETDVPGIWAAALKAHGYRRSLRLRPRIRRP